MITKDPQKIVGEYNQKIRQREDNEDRSLGYRNMIYAQDKLYCIDLDLACMINLENGLPKMVAGLELTRIGHHKFQPRDNYFKAIIRRYRKEAQKKYSIYITGCCGAPSIIVAFSEDLMNFYLYNLTKDNNKWFYQNKLRHLEWHYEIRNMQIPNDLYKKNKMDSYQKSFIIEV